MSSKWFIRREQGIDGPYSIAILKSLVATDQLGPTDHVKRYDHEQWFAAATIKGLFDSHPRRTPWKPPLRSMPPTLADGHSQTVFEVFTRERALRLASESGLLIGEAAAVTTIDGVFAHDNLTTGEQLLVVSDTTSVSVATPPFPATIGGHRILKIVGSGAMGQVYLAHDDSLDRSIAIKVMHPSRASDPVARYRFICESRATAAVEHPHVVTIYQVGEIDSDGAGHGLPYIVMQFLQGDTLGAYRATINRVPLLEALRIGREIADGLCGAHRRGRIHRDIKPENIFLEGPERQVKIIDFGLARDVIEEPVAAHLTADGAVVGTPAYMSPERIGRQPIDIRSDIFGLGVVLYELLAGRLPFEGVTMMEMLVDIARGSPPALSSVAAAVPADVSDLVMRMIAHDPGQRPASAGAVSEEIGTIEKRLKAG